MSEWKASYDASHKEERAAYYEENGDVSREKDVRQHSEFRAWLQDLRDATGCEDEGPHSGRLEHHHVDPATKLHCISQMWSHSRGNVGAEMAKCVVLCVSHHRKRHIAMKQIEEEN